MQFGSALRYVASGLNRRLYRKVHATAALDYKIAPGSYISLFTRG
jgi:hypothetical protein